MSTANNLTLDAFGPLKSILRKNVSTWGNLVVPAIVALCSNGSVITFLPDTERSLHEGQVTPELQIVLGGDAAEELSYSLDQSSAVKLDEAYTVIEDLRMALRDAASDLTEAEKEWTSQAIKIAAESERVYDQF